MQSFNNILNLDYILTTSLIRYNHSLKEDLEKYHIKTLGYLNRLINSDNDIKDELINNKELMEAFLEACKLKNVMLEDVLVLGIGDIQVTEYLYAHDVITYKDLNEYLDTDRQIPEKRLLKNSLKEVKHAINYQEENKKDINGAKQKRKQRQLKHYLINKN